jgi:hypothetical protein
MPKPWQSFQEFQVDRALEAATSDPETIRQLRPMHPQDPFPPRMGFSKQVLDINTVMNIDRYVATNRSWLSGMPVMESSFTDDEYMGSGRYSMGALWS